MELDDDFFILEREKADNIWRKNQQIPISSFSGDESVASHFALVTAYEDIKKRLRESEKENSFLKKRVRLLEDQLLGKCLEDGTNSIGREKVNQAYYAYREICIERDNLKNKLDKAVKDSTDSLKALHEQLQSKEVELLQLKTELETQQVMKNLHQTPNDWEVDELNRKLKVCGLQQELELLRKECLCLRTEMRNSKQKDQTPNDHLPNNEGEPDQATHSNMQQAFWDLKKEMSNLHLVTEVQAEVLRKLRATVAAVPKKALSVAPVQCVEDLETDPMKINLTASGAVYKKQTYFLPPGDGNVCWATGDRDPPFLGLPTGRTEERPIPVGGQAYQGHDSFGRSSFDESSWVLSGSPKPGDSTFWEANINPSSPNVSAYYFEKPNQNFLHKS